MEKLFLMTVLFSGSVLSAADSGMSSPFKGLSDEKVLEFTIESLLENASKHHEVFYDNGIRNDAFGKLCAMCPVNLKHNGTTALHEAVKAGKIKNVITLLYWSANSNVTNAQKETPLHLALVAGHEDIVEVLKRAGASERFSEKFLPLPAPKQSYVRHSDK